jgi:hypothetical protein
VKNYYGIEKQASALNGLDGPLKKIYIYDVTLDAFT